MKLIRSNKFGLTPHGDVSPKETYPITPKSKLEDCPMFNNAPNMGSKINKKYIKKFTFLPDFWGQMSKKVLNQFAMLGRTSNKVPLKLLIITPAGPL